VSLLRGERWAFVSSRGAKELSEAGHPIEVFPAWRWFSQSRIVPVAIGLICP
jgi:hypothetical protein